MNTAPDQHVLIHGGGLAGVLTAAALASAVSDRYRLTLVAPDDTSSTDVFYGNVMAPAAYSFLLRLGIDEPTLVTNTGTAFSFGTRYANWPSVSPSWVQAFHLPLPVVEQVPFQHYLSYRELALEPLLVSAQAALKGVFAHPPPDARLPLSRAEYGYQFSPSQLSTLVRDHLPTDRVRVITEPIDAVDTDKQRITAVHLRSGEMLQADLFVDCRGGERTLITAQGAAFHSDRALHVLSSYRPREALGPAHRTLTAAHFGWQSQTPLQGGEAYLTICDPASAADASTAHGHADHSDDIVIGAIEAPWMGNCVAIGQAANMVEPLTPAPMMLLQRDIERLLELLPVSSDMTVEAREYNRRYADDRLHADLFQRALFEVNDLPSSPYWSAATTDPAPEKLTRKIDQFESRGLFVAYDLEPFNEEDWAILHNGMGRRPRRFDRQVEKLSTEDIDRRLAAIRHAVDAMVAKMPPHQTYMAGLKRYLDKKKDR